MVECKENTPEGELYFSAVSFALHSSHILNFSTCLDTRQPGTVIKKLDTRQSEILTNFLEIALLIPLRT